MIRHWDSWETGKRNHIFVVKVKNSEEGWKACDHAIDLMKGLDEDCPTRPFGDASDFCWSPDGSQIVYVSQNRGQKDFAWTTSTNLYIVDVKTGKRRCITVGNKAYVRNPVWWDQKIVFLGMSKPQYESDRQRVKIYDIKTEKTTNLTEHWDRSPDSVVVTPDGKSLILVAQEYGRMKIFKLDLDSKEGTDPKCIVEDHCNNGVSCLKTKDGYKLVFTQSSLKRPNEVCDSMNQLTAIDLHLLI